MQSELNKTRADLEKAEEISRQKEAASKLELNKMEAQKA